MNFCVRSPGDKFSSFPTNDVDFPIKSAATSFQDILDKVAEGSF